MKQSIPFLILVLTIFGAQAETPEVKTHIMAVRPEDRIMIKLADSMEITIWDRDSLEIEVETKTRGRVWGFQGGGKNGYDVTLNRTGGSVIAEEIPGKDQWTVGINTRTEEHIHRIFLPASASIELITEGAQIRMHGICRNLRIESRKGDILLTAPWDRIRTMQCVARRGNIRAGGSDHERTFFKSGKGGCVAAIRLDEGNITLHLLE